MNASLRRDSLWTVLGLTVVASLFLFGIYWPGHRTNLRVREEIAAAEKALQSVPLRVAELESLRRDVQRRRESLHKASVLVPADDGLPAVLRQITRLAGNSGLKVTRLEPLSPVLHESYRVVPLRVSLTGEFRGIAAFLHGIETRERLFTVEEFSLRPDSRGATAADLLFSVYARPADRADFNKIDAISGRTHADNKKW